jgi:hypothetical protein
MALARVGCAPHTARSTTSEADQGVPGTLIGSVNLCSQMKSCRSRSRFSPPAPTLRPELCYASTYLGMTPRNIQPSTMAGASTVASIRSIPEEDIPPCSSRPSSLDVRVRTLRLASRKKGGWIQARHARQEQFRYAVRLFEVRIARQDERIDAERGVFSDPRSDRIRIAD